MECHQIESLTDPQVDQLVDLFHREWWTAGRTRRDVLKMLRHSPLVVAFEEADSGSLLAFSRVFTDQVYKALILDVIVAPYARSIGLGSRLLQAILQHESLREVRDFELYCLPELKPFYREFGFTDELGGLRLLRLRRR